MEVSRQSIGIAKRVGEMERMATMDPLTGAFNRRKFDEVVEREIERIRRYGIDTFSIVMADIDDFKMVNDRYGHRAGDEVLRRFVEEVGRQLRKNDMLFRWGGEEFLVLLPHTACLRAIDAAEKIRRAVAAIETPFPGGVTCSLGVAEFSLEEGLEAAIERADAMLYRAKREGKDRVIAACD
jgi:diguanylate cyclase (GGDEF)-like protein